MPATIDLEDLSFDEGAHLLIARGLAGLCPGDVLTVWGVGAAFDLMLGAWCRTAGHRVDSPDPDPTVGRHPVHIIKGLKEDHRWARAVRAGRSGQPSAGADRRWGLAARGALVGSGGPELDVRWVERDLVWADVAPTLYARAAANQWNPDTAVDWNRGPTLPDDVEDAVVQVMTYLVENEQAALMIPARLLGSLHPQFREVMQLLAAQIADEARHVEIFTRRALLTRDEMGRSGVEGRASLQSLLDEPDFTLASFLLSVLGEGTFVDLLGFLHEHAPDPVTAQVTALAARDEARHVAFGVAHAAHVVDVDPTFRGRLRGAVERRHDALRDTAGLSSAVYDSLVLLAAGSWEPAAVRRGWRAVQALQARMDDGRRRRLSVIGFPDDEAAELSALHTRNFM
ncbi:ferritin-like domain-containing protein [Gordonia sp. TBRC 11910]|uniref:Ferritin-like domain-containing protein n=1 Tax=Gordonia asplenii TaxID=2725283 RepID=A0A848KN45_9ACTN|nr:ferritin-like domain-containing protein [Gordonia asplenii]NMN99679.1 ferritin-like domain-containing protein [Gordonia asplenii]